MGRLSEYSAEERAAILGGPGRPLAERLSAALAEVLDPRDFLDARDVFLYLASPYSAPVVCTGKERWDDPVWVRRERCRDSCLIAGELMAAGFIVFCPVAHGHAVSGYAEFSRIDASARKLDLAIIAMASLSQPAAILVLCLSGWRESRGVAAERALARDLGTPELFLVPDEAVGLLVSREEPTL